MKWVKFKDDFELKGGSLSRYLRNGDKLLKYKKTDDNTHEPDILVSPYYNDVIKSCFRIYDETQAKFGPKFLGKQSVSNKNAEYFHIWHHETGLPKEYFDPSYFDDKYYGVNKKYFKKNETFYDNNGNSKNQLLTYDSANAYVNASYPRPHPYEIYIGGWIHFFDEEVRCGESDHAVYFQWEVEERAVIIYIMQTKHESHWNVNINANVNITKSPTSTDPPPPKTGQPPC